MRRGDLGWHVCGGGDEDTWHVRMSRPSSLTRLGSLLSPNSPRSFRKQMTNKLDFPDLNGERGASCFLNVSTKIVRAVWLSDEHSMRCVSSFPQCVELVWRLHRWEVNIFLKILLVDIFIFLLLGMRLWLYLWVCVRSLWARNVCLLGGDIDWAHLLINLSYLAWGMNMNNIIGLHL